MPIVIQHRCTRKSLTDIFPNWKEWSTYRSNYQSREAAEKHLVTLQSTKPSWEYRIEET